MKAKFAPGERNARLLQGAPGVTSQVLSHPRQIENLARVATLLTRLRACRTSEDLYTFQRGLVGEIYSADEWRAQCVDIELRLRGGAGADPSWTEVDWGVERKVADRVARQLRTVADALIWRCFGYSRPLILALSNNRSDRNLFGKSGFWCELTVLEDLWTKSGHFALVSDATNVLTVSDVVECSLIHATSVNESTHTCNSERFLLHEVKRRGDQCVTVQRGAQLATMQAAVDAVVNNHLVGPDGITRQIFRAQAQFKTHLRAVSKLIDQAESRGFAVGRLQQGWVTAVRRPVQMLGMGVTNEERGKAEDEALANAGFQHGRHRFLISTADTLAQATALAPLSIYPFPPDICAELICDHLAIVSCLEMPALTSALSSAGFEAVQEAVDPDINRPDAPIVRGIYKGHAISINSSALQQIALEFLDVKRQADAMLEAVTAAGTPAGIGVLTLTNESATWR